MHGRRVRIILVGLLFLVWASLSAGVIWAAHALAPMVPTGTCPPVVNTLDFTIVYGSVTIDGLDAPAGTVVEARSPRGDVTGCFVVSEAGSYGTMFVYGEDTFVTPPLPGMRGGEMVAFYVNDIAATPVPTLTWTNDHDIHEVAVHMTIIPVQAGFVASPTIGAVPLAVVFTSTSTGHYTTTLWSFGDGVATAQTNPTHTYTATGVYTVVLMARGPGGTDMLTRTNYITVAEPPVAGFMAAPTSGIRPLAVIFTDTSSSLVDTWLWDFGDTHYATSTQQNPTHTYSAAGIYTVTLTVGGPGGSDSLTRTSCITVAEPPPVAGFIAYPTSGAQPLTVTFTDTSSGLVDTWLWDFGDTHYATSTQPNPTHTYATAGVYTVSLQVSGPGGDDCLARVDYITVYESMPLPIVHVSHSLMAGKVGAPITVGIAVSDVVGLGRFNFTLTCSPSLIHVQDVTLGPLLGSTGRAVFVSIPAINNQAGVAVFSALTEGGAPPGPSGSGVLAWVVLTPRRVGTATLHLENVQLADVAGSAIDHITRDGVLEVTSGLRGVFLPLVLRQFP